MGAEDTLNEIYYEVADKGLKVKFDAQIIRMKDQDKHKYKTATEKWEYALYRIKGGESK
tara:strand:- start:332 stop:508 length:177 start_codon:yes stop_codon:yes gene_type:complete